MQHVVEINFTDPYASQKVLTNTEPFLYPTQNDVSHIEALEELPSNRALYFGFKGFVFAEWPSRWPALADGSYRYFGEEGYKGYMSRSLSSSSGTPEDGYSIDIRFYCTFSGSRPQYLTIQFDRVCDEYAKQLTVENLTKVKMVMVTNNTYRALITLSALEIDDGDLLAIKIQRWNKANKNAKVTKMEFSIFGQYDESCVDQYSCSHNLLEQNFKITPGILEQFADITFRDRNKELLRLSNAEMLNKNLQVAIKVIEGEDTYVQGVYLSHAWKVDGTSDKVILNCSDISSKFSNIQVPLIDLANRTLKELFTLMFSYVPQINYQYIDPSTEAYCEACSTPNSWMYAGTLEEGLLKCLSFGLLRLFWHIDRFYIARCY